MLPYLINGLKTHNHAFISPSQIFSHFQYLSSSLQLLRYRTSSLHRIRNIARLVTRDASGGDHTFSRDAVELRPGGARETIQLKGPGEILVSSNTATFLRDSKVCVCAFPTS